MKKIRHVLINVSRNTTDESFVLEAIALGSTIVLNVIDAMLTLSGFARGILIEINPLLAPLLGMPWLFITAKFLLVALGTGLLWRFKSHPWVLPGTLVLFSAYAIVVLYHLHGILALMGRV